MTSFRKSAWVGFLVMAAASAVGPSVRAAPMSSTAAGPASTSDGYLRVGFDVLGSFDFKAPDGDAGPVSAAVIKQSMAQVPGRILKLDGNRVMVTGYMLPVRMEGSRTTEFLLVSSPMLCCFGMVPRINDWVVVRMRGAGTPVQMDSPVQFCGRLHVHELVQDGLLGGIYLLDGDKMGDGTE